MTSLDIMPGADRRAAKGVHPNPPIAIRHRWGETLRRLASPERSFATAAIVYLLLCAVSFFVVRPTTLLYFSDYWEHRAILKEIVRGGTHLLDPIYGEGASSRQFTPWSLALGYVARIGHVDIDTVMALGAMTVSLVFVVGVHALARIYYAHRWAPTVLLVALTCAWGLPPLIWTGFHALRSQLYGNYFPAALVFSLSFLAWASVLRILKGGRFAVAYGALLWVVVACAVITHPLAAAFLVAGAAGLVVLESGISLPRRALAGLVIALGIGSTIFWPYFNPLSLAGAGFARGQATFNNLVMFFNPLFVIATGWGALFVLLGMPGLIRDRSLHMPLAGFAMTFAAYVIGGIADLSVSHRFLAYIFLWLQLLLVKAVLDVIDGRPPRLLVQLTPRAWRGIYASAALLVICQIGLAVQQLATPWVITHYPYPVHQVESETSQVTDTLPRGARILGWDSAALVMPSHGVLVAAFPRPMPLSPSDAARQADYARFFAPGTPSCERVAISRHWHATHIAYLTNELDETVQQELAALGPATSPAAPWRVISIPSASALHCQP